MRPLTPRQQQILRLKCATGKTNKEIARALGIKTETVKQYLTDAYVRLGAVCGPQACWLYAMRAGDV